MVAHPSHQSHVSQPCAEIKNEAAGVEAAGWRTGCRGGVPGRAGNAEGPPRMGRPFMYWGE